MDGPGIGATRRSARLGERRALVVAVAAVAALMVASPANAAGPGAASGGTRVSAECATAAGPAPERAGLTPSAASKLAVAVPAAVGTAALVRDIDPSGSSSPKELTPFLGRVAFTARDDAHGVELWITTASSATRLRDIAPGTADSQPSNLTVVGSTLFFIADDGTHGRELWKSDGTAAGTKLVKDIRPGVKGSTPGNLTPFHGKLFLVAHDGVHGGELWKSDGTAAGTKMVKDIEPGGTALYSLGRHGTTAWAVFHDRLYFDVSGSREGLWRTDGTSGGTVRVAKKLIIEQLMATSSRLYIIGSPDDGGCALPGPYLYASDGSAGGTKAVEFDGPWGALVAYQGAAWFGANGSAPYRRLYRSAGTAATTGRVLPKIALDDDTPIEAVGGKLFLSQGGALSISDGTSAGTAQLGGPDAGWRGLVDVVKLGSPWYFPGRDGTGDWELWQTDGTPLGTVVAAEVNAGGNGNVRSVVKSGGTVWFSADDGTHGTELFRYVP